MKKEIAIIGVSMKIAGADDLDQFWKLISRDEKCFNVLSDTRKNDLFNRFGEGEIAVKSYLDRIDLFDNDFFKISPAEAERMDPEQRLILEAAVRAVQNAGYLLNELRSQRIGIFHTFSESGYKFFFDDSTNLGITAHMPGMIGTRIANFMDWRGPVIGIETTCSSSLAALYYACESISNGDCSMAMAAGINLEVPYQVFNSSSAVISKSDHCLPFDKDADGTLAGEGVFCVLIKSAEDAIRDGDPIHAIIKGGAINHGGALIQNISAPSPVSQAEVIKMAWENSSVNSKDIRFIEAHGTGTILGDPIEFRGLDSAFEGADNSSCAISSVKGQLGHLNSAAGLAGLVRLLVAVKYKKLLPQLGFKTLNPHITEEGSPVHIQRKMEDWNSDGPRLGGISSYGLTGTNVHLVVQEYNDPLSAKDRDNYFAVIGADSAEKAARIKEYLQDYLKAHRDVNLSRLCYTLNKLFANTSYSKMISFADHQQLETVLNETSFTGPGESRDKQQLFLFISEVLDRENMADFFVQCPEVAAQYELKLAEAGIFRNIITERQKDFILQYCAIRVLMTNNFVPDKIIGGQYGKIMALLLSGTLAFNTAIDSLDNTENQNFNSQDFAKFLNALDPAIAYKFIIIGAEGELNKTFSDWTKTGEHDHIQFKMTIPHEDTFLHAVMNYYNWGNTLQLDKLFRKEVFLNDFYPPVFEQKRFWPIVKRRVTQVAAKVPDPLIGVVGIPVLEDIIQGVKKIWIEKLKLKDINIEDDFFDIGGSSLLGLDILQMLERVYKVDLEYPDIFDYSTIIAQAQLINDKLSANESTVSDNHNNPAILPGEQVTRKLNYEKLILDISTHNILRTEFPEKILLTGGTGFLGAYLIKELLIKTEARILCLIRAETDGDATSRLLSTLSSYFPDDHLELDRIQVIKGDITIQDLDLSLRGKEAANNVDTVFHLAASVKHYAKRENLYRINVEGTINILEWAKRSGVKHFNYYSTSAVAGGRVPGMDQIDFYESDLNVGQDYGRYVYPDSKFRAEEYIHLHKGDLKVNIFRIGNVGGDTLSGLFQENMESNGLYQRLKTFIELGFYCDELKNYVFDTTPVDVVTNIIVELSLLKNDLLNVFHLEEPEPVDFISITGQLLKQGVVLTKISKGDFLKKVDELIENSKFSDNNFILGLAKFNANDSEDTRFMLKQDATNTYLKNKGLYYSYDTAAYVSTVIRYCIDKEFIKLEK